ncbi:MAG: hypothetical protein RIA09_09930 [Hoeflea sp.]|uniref:hypothetical protein n=1 Tax=Hoeflea sp. TaxID=1940281 RepID=UPI0032EF8BFD
MIQSKRRHARSACRPRRFSATRQVLAATALFLAGAPLAGAQEELTEAERQRLAAADVVIGAEVILPELRLPFHDPFDGRALAEHWTAINADENKYVLEDGAIFALQSGGNAHPSNEAADNVFVANGIMPDQDFDLSLRVKLDPKTGYEDVWVGLWADANNYLAANLSVYTKGCGASLYLKVNNRRTLSGEEKPDETGFTKNLLDGPIVKRICDKKGRAAGDQVIAVLNDTGFTLGLSRRGYRYQASITLDVPPGTGETGDGGTETYSTSFVSRVEPFGQPFFMLGQSSKAGNGETSALFEDLTIVAAQ